VASAPMVYLLALLLALLAGCDDDHDVPLTAPPAVQVEDTATAVSVRSAAATVRIDKASVHFTLQDANGARLTESAGPPTLMRDDVAQPLHAVHSVELLERESALRGAQLTCDTDSGSASLTIEFLSARSVAVRLRPAPTTGVTRVVTTLHAAADEHFYGLTERIVDAPTADPRDRRVSEIAPKAIG